DDGLGGGVVGGEDDFEPIGQLVVFDRDLDPSGRLGGVSRRRLGLAGRRLGLLRRLRLGRQDPADPDAQADRQHGFLELPDSPHASLPLKHPSLRPPSQKVFHRRDEGPSPVLISFLLISWQQFPGRTVMKLRSALFLVLAAAAVPLYADPDIHDTRLLSEPAVSAKQIAFIYAGDLWTCDLDGKNARRLTSDPGAESRPAFSPDGKWIAFSAQYEGNTDVYVVSSEGGVPRRLTWHPGPDEVQGFTPDGKSVL